MYPVQSKGLYILILTQSILLFHIFHWSIFSSFYILFVTITQIAIKNVNGSCVLQCMNCFISNSLLDSTCALV